MKRNRDSRNITTTIQINNKQETYIDHRTGYSLHNKNEIKIGKKSGYLPIQYIYAKYCT